MSAVRWKFVGLEAAVDATREAAVLTNTTVKAVEVGATERGWESTIAKDLRAVVDSIPAKLVVVTTAIVTFGCIVVIILYRRASAANCGMRGAHTGDSAGNEAHSAKSERPPSSSPPPPFTRLDLMATLFLPGVNAGALTCLLPIAEAIARSRLEPSDESHMATEALRDSGFFLAIGSVGSLLSVVLYYSMPSRWHESRCIYVASPLCIILGVASYVVALLMHASTSTLAVCRIASLIGSGVKYSLKVRMAKTLPAKLRTRMTLFISMSTVSGIASAPLVVSGAMKVVQLSGRESTDLAFQLLGLAVVATFFTLVALVLFFVPSEPVFQDEIAEADAKADPKEWSPQKVDAARSSSASKDPKEQLPVEPTLTTTVIVVTTCLYYGGTRQFIRYSYETAMTVVYVHVFDMSLSSAGMLASSLAYSSLFAVLLFELLHRNGLGDWLIRHGIRMCEALFFAAGMLLMFSGGVMWLTVLTAVCVYPAGVLGASISNAHVLKYRQRNNWLFTVEALLLQQDVVNMTAPGLGLYVGRVVLGDPVSTYGLGIVFVAIAASHSLLVRLGWDPEATGLAGRRALSCMGCIVSPTGLGVSPDKSA